MKRPTVMTGIPLVLFPVLAACTGPNPCPPEIPPSLEVTVVHAQTGQPVEDALTIARDGAFVDSARTRPTGQAALALNRNQEASYNVMIDKEGFQGWSRLNVHVGFSQTCRVVDTAELQVDLVPR